MEKYPIRERIYLPVKKAGVPHTDWKWIVLITAAGLFAPTALNIWIKGVPAMIFTGLPTLMGAIIFFNIIRNGKPPRWLENKIKDLFSSDSEREIIPRDTLDESIYQ